MMILALVRNYIPAYQQVVNGQWDIAAIADRAWDLEGKFRLPAAVEKDLNLTFHKTAEDLVKVCDVVTINCPLHPETENLFNAKMLKKMKKGAYLVNTARGKIVNTHDLEKAITSGHLAGYAGDVWFPQPAPADHPWRRMPNHAMTPHYSGTTLSAQARYAKGVREILENHFDKKPQRIEYLIAQNGSIVSPAYTMGNATHGAK